MADDIMKAENLAETMNDATKLNQLPKGRAVDEKTIISAWTTLKKYQDGLKMFKERIKDEEDWWRMRHWGHMNYGNPNDERPTSGWLFNTIISKHAELMAAYPTFNCLPREQGDKEQAKRLSDILPVVLQQNDFEDVYSQEGWTKLKYGVGIFGVFWDKNKLNGLGDIQITSVNPSSLYWQPGITDIQASKNVFFTQKVENSTLLMLHPELEGKLGGSEIVDDEKKDPESRVEEADMSTVVDWYYKKPSLDGRSVLHYAKFVNHFLLFSSENEPEKYPDGWYAHGQYPFVFDVLFPDEGSITGFGYIAVCRDPQKYIDLIGQAVTKSALIGATPRYFIRRDGNVDETEFADITKPFVHIEGNLTDESVREIRTAGLDGMYINFMQSKIEEMKETAGNRDVSNGGTTSGVTAASAIAAQQEASGKVSRDSTKASYRAYRKLINLCIELVRQFYDMPRQFRIIGQQGMEEFIQYDNAGIKPSPIDNIMGDEMYRLPVFDLEISAQEENAYTKMSQNELALQFYQMGFFNPQMADQALACLDMMDFKGKTEVVQKIQMYQTLQEQLIMWQQMAIAMAQKYGDPMVNGLAQASGMGQMLPQGDASKPEMFTEGKKEGKRMEKAREEANTVYTP